MKLDERLSLCAQMVRDGAAVADIGTDHAYLPVYLVECGKIHKAIAAVFTKPPLGLIILKKYIPTLKPKITRIKRKSSQGFPRKQSKANKKNNT